MAEFRADLHCHSNCSDGTDSPLELIKKAEEKGLQGLSITDHDTTAAYTPELFSAATSASIRLLTGVEISSELDQIPVHILGYGYDLASSSFSSFLSLIQARRTERNRAMLRLLHEKGMHIDEAELSSFGKGAIGRPHMAQALIQKGYVRTIQEAFDKFLKNGAPCYFAGQKYSPQEAIEEIHKGGGKAVLAHPHFYRKRRFIEKILSFAFDGIECHYAALPKAQELPWLKIAKERNWIATGGSDYHGTVKETPLGASWVDEEVFNRLSSP